MKYLRTLANLSLVLAMGSSACAETANELPAPRVEPAQSAAAEAIAPAAEVTTAEDAQEEPRVLETVVMDSGMAPESNGEPLAAPADEPQMAQPGAADAPSADEEPEEPVLMGTPELTIGVTPKSVEIPVIQRTTEPEAVAASTGMPVVDEPIAIQEEPQAVGFDHSHALWSALLKRHVKGSNFNYGALKKDQAKFKQYLAQLHAVTPAELKAFSKDQRYAFWINVYNAHTIQIVVDNYPLKGIRSLDTGFGLNSVFDKEFIPMKPHHPKGANDKLSLNDVENTILREVFKDARVHAAINCASISCPPLRNEAFVAENLEQQLNGQMKAFVNDPSRNEFDLKRNKVKASSIFKWFKPDFERDAGGAQKFMARYAKAGHQELLRSGKFSYLDYNWKLNDAK